MSRLLGTFRVLASASLLTVPLVRLRWDAQPASQTALKQTAHRSVVSVRGDF